MTPVRPLAAHVAALGIAVFAVPLPASAAVAERPALAPRDSCAGAERYAALSGAEMLRVGKLSVRAAGGGRARSADADPAKGSADTGKPGGKSDPAGAGEPDSGADKSDPASAGGAGTGTDAGKPDGTDAGTEAGRSRPTDDTDGPEAAGKAHSARGGPRKPVDSQPADGLRLGEAKSALVADAAPSAAAVSRMLSTAEDTRLSKALTQTAPPSSARPAPRKTPPAAAGPLLVDAGTLTSGARWQTGMACGATHGEVTRAAATVGAATISGEGDAALMAVPEKVSSLSTTALERASGGARSVAEATIAARTFELLDGAVQVKVLRAPTLRTAMSTVGGGEVRYRPAAIEISGEGIKTTKLDAPGDSMEMTFNERQTESLVPPRLTGGVTEELPLPSVPGLPPLSDEREPESVASPGSGTNVRISLGDVRQAMKDHAVAAKATAIKVGIAQRGGDDGYGRGADVTFSVGIGVLESAAVAPQPGAEVAGVAGGEGGGGSSLPITGPRVDVMLLLAGAGLLVAGAGALTFGLRRRRFSA